jgi:hypothetical protein
MTKIFRGFGWHESFLQSIIKADLPDTEQPLHTSSDQLDIVTGRVHGFQSRQKLNEALDVDHDRVVTKLITLNLGVVEETRSYSSDFLELFRAVSRYKLQARPLFCTLTNIAALGGKLLSEMIWRTFNVCRQMSSLKLRTCSLYRVSVSQASRCSSR